MRSGKTDLGTGFSRAYFLGQKWASILDPSSSLEAARRDVGGKVGPRVAVRDVGLGFRSGSLIAHQTSHPRWVMMRGLSWGKGRGER
jgi:hypothetical protein